MTEMHFVGRKISSIPTTCKTETEIKNANTEHLFGNADWIELAVVRVTHNLPAKRFLDTLLNKRQLLQYR
jgi:hypothetical protein